jgi:hypothetical protein
MLSYHKNTQGTSSVQHVTHEGTGHNLLSLLSHARSKIFETKKLLEKLSLSLQKHVNMRIVQG